MNLTTSTVPRVSVLVLLADAGAVYGSCGAFGGEQLVKVGELTGCESKFSFGRASHPGCV